MKIHVVSYLLEGEQEQEHECYLTARSARIRLRELEKDEVGAAEKSSWAYFALRPEARVINIPCNAQGIVAAIEGRWRKYEVHEVVP